MKGMNLSLKFSDKDKEKVFFRKVNDYTFDDMMIEEMKPALRLYEQHFSIRKPERYTTTPMGVTIAFSFAQFGIPQARPNFVTFILNSIVQHASSRSIVRKPYLFASHMLTTIAYQAIGMIDDLPQPMRQVRASDAARTSDVTYKRPAGSSSKAPTTEAPTTEPMLTRQRK